MLANYDNAAFCLFFSFAFIPSFDFCCSWSAALTTQVVTWTSLKKFCDEHYPDLKFKNDDARKKHCIKKGLEIQRDDEGRDGIAVSKAGDADTKEIRVGKRLSATKVKSMKYAEDVDKNELAAQHSKNAANLKVNTNSKDRWQWQCDNVIPSSFPIMRIRMQHHLVISYCNYCIITSFRDIPRHLHQHYNWY